MFTKGKFLEIVRVMDQEWSVVKAKVGDRFIKPDSKKIYIVVKVVLGGDWVILEEEGGDRHFLTSQEGLETWIKYKKD
jgi:hypothetical protein